ncbi:MAG: hypothetical protein IJK31_07345 [Ruminococcus sp.]|nr:hypothetical protein [Ruminococcus sp.]
MYKREQYYPYTSVNSICMEIIFSKKIDYDKINEAINIMLKSCPMMRTQICTTNIGIKQYISEYRKKYFPMIELDTMDDYEKWREEKLYECVYGSDKPLYRFYIVRIKDESKWIIYTNIHHLLTDANGNYIVIDRIIRNIDGDETEARINDYDYSEYIAKEKNYLKSRTYYNDTKFWQEITSEYEGQALFTSDNDGNIEHIRYKSNFSSEMSTDVKEFCEKHDISVPCFFYAIYGFLKSRITYSNSSSIAVALHNRGSREKKYAGMFMTILPLILKIDSDSTIADFIKYVKLSEISLLKHRRYTYGLLQENCEVKDGLLDLAVSYQNFSLNNFVERGYKVDWLGNGHVDAFSVSISERNSEGVFLFEYEFPEKNILKNLLNYFMKVL